MEAVAYYAEFGEEVKLTNAKINRKVNYMGMLHYINVNINVNINININININTNINRKVNYR